MATLYGIIALNRLSQYNVFRGIDPSDFSIKLPTDREYELGIDQSTSCTGVYLQDTKEDISILVDVVHTEATKKDYVRELFRFLNKLICEIEVRLVVCEKPIPREGQTRTFRILTELKGKLELFLDVNPSLQNAELHSIYPQSWKSRIVNKAKGVGRMNVKACIAEDLCDEKPLLRNYYPLCPTKDFDSFDALGILAGYKRCAFTHTGVPKIWGDVEKRHGTRVYYRYVALDPKLNSLGELEKFLKKDFRSYSKVWQPKLKAYNSDYNLIRNFKMASSTDKMTITILPEKVLEPLRWEFELERDEKKSMVAYITREGKFSKKEREFLEDMFPCNLFYGSIK